MGAAVIVGLVCGAIPSPEAVGGVAGRVEIHGARTRLAAMDVSASDVATRTPCIKCICGIPQMTHHAPAAAGLGKTSP